MISVFTSFFPRAFFCYVFILMHLCINLHAPVREIFVRGFRKIFQKTIASQVARRCMWQHRLWQSHRSKGTTVRHAIWRLLNNKELFVKDKNCCKNMATNIRRIAPLIYLIQKFESTRLLRTKVFFSFFFFGSVNETPRAASLFFRRKDVIVLYCAARRPFFRSFDTIKLRAEIPGIPVKISSVPSQLFRCSPNPPTPRVWVMTASSWERRVSALARY